MNENKKCKYCQSEIDKKAKVCPNCRKKQGGVAKFIIIAVVAFILIGALTQNNDDTSTEDKTVATADNKQKPETAKTKEATPTPEPAKTTFSIGETASQKDILVTLVSVTENKGSQFNSPGDGKVFLLCEFQIENDSKKDISVSSMLSFEAYCDDYSINQSIMALLEKDDKQQLDGSVASGKKMNGVIGYEVSEDWSKLEISFKPSFWSSKDIKFIAEK